MTAFLTHRLQTNRPDTLPGIAEVRNAILPGLTREERSAVIVTGNSDRVCIHVQSRGVDLLQKIVTTATSKGFFL